MKLKCNYGIPAIAVFATIAIAPWTKAAMFTMPVEGWVVHNGSNTIAGAGTDSPTFTTGDNITAMGTFPEIELKNDGDYLTFSTQLTMTGRSTIGAATLNTQLRIGLFDGPDGAVVGPPTPDTPNLGFIIEYNAAAAGLIREQQNTLQANPFTSATNIGTASPADTDTIAGANPPPVDFVLTLTRSGGMLDLTGQISGGNHLANYSKTGITSVNFPLDGIFSFNRVGLFLGDGVNSTTANLSGSKVVTNVPEPASGLLAAIMTIGGLLARRRTSHAA